MRENADKACCFLTMCKIHEKEITLCYSFNGHDYECCPYFIRAEVNYKHHEEGKNGKKLY